MKKKKKEKEQCERSWMREAISDENGEADIAYVSIAVLTLAAIATLAFVCGIVWIDYTNCAPQTLVAKGENAVTSVVPCRFDPLPMGQAAGLIFGAFAGLIASLAGYMAATRKRP